MATFQITGPDGGQYQVNAPDNATQEQVLAYVQQNSGKIPAVNNADQNLGGTLQFGPWDTGIKIPASVEAGLVGAGKTFMGIGRGIANPTTNAQTDQTVAEENRLYQPLSNAHPVATTVGEIAPYLAAGLASPTLASPVAGAALNALDYGTAQDRATNAALGYVGGKVGQGVARMFGPTSMAGGAAAANPYGIPTTPGMNGSKMSALAESVLSNLPFGGAVSDARNAAFQGFNRAVSQTFGADASKITPEMLGQAQKSIGSTIGDIAGRNTIAVDQPLFSGLQSAVQRAQQELTPEQSKIVTSQIQNLWNSVDPQTGTIPGTLYKAFQSKFGEIGKNNGGTLSSIMYDMRASLRDAMTRSVSPQDSEAWLTANKQYFNVQQVANAAKATPGNLSPSQLLTQVNKAQTQAKFGGGNDLAQLAQWAKPTLTDQIPNSGTAQRLWMQYALTHPMQTAGGLLGTGAGLYEADKAGFPVGDLAYSIPAVLMASRFVAGKPAGPALRGMLTSGGAGAGLLGYSAFSGQ